MRISAYVAPRERALSSATAPSPSNRSGGTAPSARRVTKAPGIISIAASASAEAPHDLRNSLRLPPRDRLLEPGDSERTPPPLPGHPRPQEPDRMDPSVGIGAPACGRASAGAHCERAFSPRRLGGPPRRDGRAVIPSSGASAPAFSAGCPLSGG